MQEPKITINGIELSHGQSATLRVAVQHLVSDMRAKGLGKDAMGKRLTALYIARCEEIKDVMRVADTAPLE